GRVVSVGAEACRYDRAFPAEGVRNLATSACARPDGNHHPRPRGHLIIGVGQIAEAVDVWTDRSRRAVAQATNESQACVRHRALDEWPALPREPVNPVGVRRVIEHANEAQARRRRKPPHWRRRRTLKSVRDDVYRRGYTDLGEISPVRVATD